MSTKTVARWTVYSALFIIPFLSLVVAGSPFFPNFFFPFITGKGFFFRILVEIALAAWVVLAAVDKRYRPQFSWTLVLFSAFVLWVFVADLLGVNPHKALWSNYERMDGFVTLAHLYVFFLIAATVLTADKLWRKWWLTFLSGVFIVCLYSLFQMGGGLAIHQGSTRVDATLGNAAYLAAYLLFAVAVSLWQALESKKWMRYSLFALTALEVFVLFATATRGAILGLIGATLLGALLWMIESGKGARKGAAVVLVGLVVVVGGFFVLRTSPIITSNPVLGRIASISLNDGTTRFAIWNIAWQGFLERPVFGWGQEGFNYVFNTYYDPGLYAQEQWFDRAHDVFLDWLIAGGLPALLLFLALLGSAVVVFYRGNASRAERVMLISALAAYSFQALFVFDNLFTYVPLAALLACAHAAASRSIKKLEELPEAKTMESTMPISLVSVAAGLLILWSVNVPSMVASMDLIYGLSSQSNFETNLALLKKALAEGGFASQEIREQILMVATAIVQSPNASDALKNEFAHYAIDQMNMEIQRTPKDARLYLEQASAFRAFGDVPDALKEIEIAQSLSPKKESLYVEYGITAWEGKQYAVAATAFAKAYALGPQFDGLNLYNAAGLILTGRVSEAEKLLTDHFGTAVIDDDILASAYYEIKAYNKMIPLMQLRVKNQNGSANANLSLAQVYIFAGRIAEARALIQKTIDEHPEASATGAALLQSLNGK